MIHYFSVSANLTFVGELTYLELYIYCETEDTDHQLVVQAVLVDSQISPFLRGCVDLVQRLVALFESELAS